MSPRGKIDVLKVAEARELFRSGQAQEIRRAGNLSQADMAAALGVSRPTYSSWELGTRRPRRELAVQVLALLDVLRNRTSGNTS